MAEAQVVAEVLPVFEGGQVADAFHGTIAAAASDIMERHGFRLSKNQPGMYGQGVYFFEGDYWAALWWARKRSRASHAGPPRVIRSQVDLGQTLYANVMAPEIERLRPLIAKALGISVVSEEQAWQLLTAALQRAGIVDSIRVAREADKKWLPPDSPYKFEVVICVFDPKRAKPIQILTPEDTKEVRQVAVL